MTLMFAASIDENVLRMHAHYGGENLLDNMLQN
jgi:hypothetical protein